MPGPISFDAATAPSAVTISSETFLSTNGINVAGLFTAYIDLNNMAAGDVTEFRVYRMVDGTNARVMIGYPITLAGAQPTDAKILMLGPFSNAQVATNAMRVSIKQTFGTGRSYPWMIINDLDGTANTTQFGGTNGTFTAGRPEVNTTHAAGTAWGSGAITAASIAADAITAAKVADGTIDAATFAAGAINAAAIAADAITAAKIADGAIDAATFAAGAINAAAIAADAITDAKVAADVTIASVTGAVGSVTGAVGSVTGNVGGNVTGSVGSIAAGGIAATSFVAGAIDAAAIAANAIGASELAADAVAEIADAVWDEVKSGHLTAGTYGEHFGSATESATVNDAAATTTSFVTTLASAVNSHYVGRVIIFTSGALLNQATDITAYVGATKTVTVTALTSAPANGVSFVVV